jgi:hypothetical protein
VFNRLNATAAELARAKAAALVSLSSALLLPAASNASGEPGGAAYKCANGAPMRNCSAQQPAGCAACGGERQLCVLDSCGGCGALCFDFAPAAVLGLPENFNPIGTGIMGGILAALKKASPSLSIRVLPAGHWPVGSRRSAPLPALPLRSPRPPPFPRSRRAR